MNTSLTKKEYPIIVENTLSRTVYLKLFLLMNFNNWAFYLVLAVLAFLTVLVHHFGDYGFLFFFAWGIFGFYAVVVIISILYSAFSSQNQLFFLPMRYTFSEEGIEEVSEIAHCVVKWDAFIKWKYVADHYLLYLNILNAVVIPRSKIPDHQVSAFEELLRSKVKKKQRYQLSITLVMT